MILKRDSKRIKELEEIKKIFSVLTEQWGDTDNYINYLLCYSKELQQENKQLKKKLEEKENIACDWKDSCLENAGKIEILETQQKEFISYLENGIDICDGFLDTVKSDLQEIPYGVISAGKTYITTQIKENETTHKVYGEILQKYREIIGGKDE